MTRRALLLAVALACWPLTGAAQSAERVVVVGPALVEIAFALGAGEEIVAVDDNATHPPEAREKPSVGYFRKLAAEGVLALRPTLVIATSDAGPDTVFPVVKAAGVEVALSPEADGLDAVPEKIAFVGRALDRETEAAALTERYRQTLAAARAAAPSRASKPRALFVMAIRGGSVVAAGADTIAGAMFEAAGGENAGAAFSGYKPVSPEAIIALAPDMVIMMPDRLEAAGGRDQVLAMPGFGQTPAAATGRLHTMEPGLLLRLGPRSPDGLRRLADWFAAIEK